jgi:hypothetical protein
MPVITGDIQIEASKERVWEAIADLGSIQDFHPEVTRPYYTSEQREGVGASRHCDLKPFGSVEERAIGWEDGSSFALEIYDSKKMPPFRFAVESMSVAEKGARAVAYLSLEYELRYGAIGSLLDWLMVRSRFEKMVPAVLAGLKKHLEGGLRSIDDSR